MARSWLRIRVYLLGSREIECEPPPGRIFLVGPRHSFGELAEAIDIAFARWELSRPHGFELTDGRRIGVSGPKHPEEWLSESALKVAMEIEPGDSFEYTFDPRDHWRHRCTVDVVRADPRREYGMLPLRPTAVGGWGSIPDQHGRAGPED